MSTSRILVYDLQHLLAEQYLPVRKNKIKVQQHKQKEFVEIKGGFTQWDIMEKIIVTI